MSIDVRMLKKNTQIDEIEEDNNAEKEWMKDFSLKNYSNAMTSSLINIVQVNGKQ
jgi:hypothetical protein